MISLGKVESLSSSRATGRISFSAKSWASWRMSFCSSVRVKSTTVLRLLERDACARLIDSSVQRCLDQGTAGLASRRPSARGAESVTKRRGRFLVPFPALKAPTPRRSARLGVLTAPGYPRSVDAFGTVVIVLAVVAITMLASWGSGRVYRGLGSSGLGMDHETPSAAGSPLPLPRRRGSPDARRPSRRGVGRGARPRLMWTPRSRPSRARPRPRTPRRLREEVRQLVVARNERRPPGQGAAGRGGRGRAPAARSPRMTSASKRV